MQRLFGFRRDREGEGAPLFGGGADSRLSGGSDGRLPSSSLERERARCCEELARRTEARQARQLVRDMGYTSRVVEEKEEARFREIFARRVESQQGAGCGAAASCGARGGSMALSVIRSGLWSDDGSEDTWQVEIPRAATVADLKARIAELYAVPEEAQRLQTTSDPFEPCLPDMALVQQALEGGQPLYLLPVLAEVLEHRDERASEDDGFEEARAAEQERAAELRAVEESLHGVAYRVTFVRPEAAGGQAAGARKVLSVDALALVGDVQAMVEVELLGAANREPAYMTFNGEHLPLDAPLHYVGVGDGDTVIVGIDAASDGRGAEDSDGDSFDAALQSWVGEG